MGLSLSCQPLERQEHGVQLLTSVLAAAFQLVLQGSHCIAVKINIICCLMSILTALHLKITALV